MSTDLDPSGARAPRRKQLGDFILLEEIGRGGMGRVYRARQISLERHVALKVLPSLAGLDREAVARFQREAEAAGRLSHPGIVPIYGVGSVDGIYYYAMELVEGPSVCQLLDGLRGTDPQDLQHTLAEETAMAAIYPNLQENPVPSFLAGSAYPASCAALIMEVAGALTAAHQGMVIHRDLKPSNILLHPAGRPVLADFGLARDELALSMTQTGDAVGTPAYMAPEQAAGTRGADARVDVYGLGATLYEMLTLRPPFDGKHSAEVMQAILDEDPVPPRRLNPRVPKALEAIVLKCLAKDPEQRYLSMTALASDLRSFLAGGDIQARCPGVLGALGRRLQRNRQAVQVALVAMMSALLVGLLVGLVILDTSRQQGRQELLEARELLADGQGLASHAAFMRALALLGDREWVDRERLLAFREVFPAMYAAGRLEALRSFLETLGPDELDNPEYHHFRQRIRGMGHLAIATDDQQQPRVYVRRARSGNFESGWRRLSVDGALSTGHYLVRIQAQGMENVVRATRVSRDQLIRLRPALQPAGSLPEGTRLVDPGAGQAFAVEREEVTVRRYAQLLASIEDTALQGAMTPLHWAQQERPDVPVTGLSHWQAGVAAQLMGSHLLSPEEYSQAATAGLPELSYPWGNQFDRRRVVGDPRYSSRPLAGPSRPMGASPGGILHLVGNVEEPLARMGRETILSAGGSYQSEPRDLSVRSLDARAGMFEQRHAAGLRLARFLPGPEDPASQRALLARLRSLSSERLPCIANHWKVAADGQVAVQQQVRVAAGARSLMLPALDGFSALEPPRVVDGDGAVMGWSAVHEGGALLGYRVELAPDGEGGLTDLTADRILEPRSGLHAQGDCYCLRMPLSTRTSRAVDSLTLPAGCRVEAVWPTPDAEFLRDGTTVLAWYRGLEGSQPRSAQQVFVQFRRDGALTSQQPSAQPVTRFVQRLFAARAARDVERLTPMLAADCRVLSSSAGGLERLGDPGSWDAYSDPRVLDVTSVGRVLSVELRVSWDPAAMSVVSEPVHGWSLRMQVRRTGRGFELVGLTPARSPDLGDLTGGVYQHPDLGVRVDPPAGVVMRRGHHGMVELQLTAQPTGPAPERSLTILGCMGDGDESSDSLQARLVRSAAAGARGERVGRRSGVDLADQLEGTSQNWLFEGDDGWRCEQWTFVTRGRRQFLIQSVARGATRELAQRAFQSAGPWFVGVADALQIQ